MEVKKIGDDYIIGSKLSEKAFLLEKLENAKLEGKEWKVKKIQEKLKKWKP